MSDKDFASRQLAETLHTLFMPSEAPPSMADNFEPTADGREIAASLLAPAPCMESPSHESPECIHSNRLHSPDALNVDNPPASGHPAPHPARTHARKSSLR
jgi:hypothetical protein